MLLQVVLHARMAEEAEQPWSIDDLAGDLVDEADPAQPARLRRRRRSRASRRSSANWERIKREEKSAHLRLDGIAWPSRRCPWPRRCFRGPRGPAVQPAAAGPATRTSWA